MSKTTHTSLALLAALLVALAASAAVPRGWDAAESSWTTVSIADSDPSEVGLSAETERVRAHLERVERELRARDVSHLSPEQRSARARNLDVLREYHEAGVFPHNHDFPDRRVPYFVDRHGTLCAVAYLIARSGQPELVRRVATTANNARVPELAEDPELIAWLERNGLTLEEAAMIQPWYGGDSGPWPPADRDELSNRYLAASLTADVVAGAVTMLNLSSRSSQWTGLLGTAVGTSALALGAANVGSDDDATRLLAGFNLGLGAASTAIGLHAILREEPATDEGGIASSRAALGVAPFLAPEGGAGVRLQLRF